MTSNQTSKQNQASVASTLLERQGHDAVSLKHLQALQADDLRTRSEEDDSEEHQHIRQDAALALKDSQARRAAALKTSHEEHAASLKEAHAMAKEKLDEKSQMISWLTGGYSVANKEEE